MDVAEASKVTLKMVTLVRFVAPGTRAVHDWVFQEAIKLHEFFARHIEPGVPASCTVMKATFVQAIEQADRFESMDDVPRIETLELLDSRSWRELDNGDRRILASWLMKSPYHRAVRCLHDELCEPRDLIEAILDRPHGTDNAWHQFVHRAHLEYDHYYNYLRDMDSPKFPGIFRGAIEGIWSKRQSERQSEEENYRALATALRWLREEAPRRSRKRSRR